MTAAATPGNQNSQTSIGHARQSISRVMFKRTPILSSVKNSDVPPSEMKGSVIPLVGTSARTTLMLKNAWMMMVAVMPKARKRANGSVESRAARRPR